MSDTPRTKWGEPSKSVDVNAERPRWAVNNDVALSQMVLEETGGNMEGLTNVVYTTITYSCLCLKHISNHHRTNSY